MSIKYIKKVIYSIIVTVLNFPTLITNSIAANSKKSKIYLLDTPTHGNLGDQAIAYSELSFIKEKFGNKFAIVEKCSDDFNESLTRINKKIKSSDILVIQGGGNFGDEYEEFGVNLRSLCLNFKDNRIILFPQSFYYKNKQKETEIINFCKEFSNLHIYLREEVSYNRLNDKLSNCFLVPDIVFNLYPQIYNLSRKENQVLICLRRDCERVMSDLEREQIYSSLKNKGFDLKYQDTVINRVIAQWMRKKYLKSIFRKMGESKLVVTDRLHGMIFCAITGTPCIVLSNYNHKIKSTYQTWLTCLNYIYFLDDLSEFDIIVEKVYKCNPNHDEVGNVKNKLNTIFNSFTSN